MKKMLIFTLFLWATQSFAIQVTQWNCNDTLQDWQVVARISEGTGSVRGTLNAQYRGWKIISENLNKSTSKLGAVEYISSIGSESAFGIKPQDKSYWLRTSKGVVPLACRMVISEQNSKTCQIKTCHPDGARFYNIQVPQDYECQSPNIHCKI